MTTHPWGASTPEMNAVVLETGTTGATWAAASMAWLGLAEATLAAMGITGTQMAASIASISGMRSAMHEAATPPFMTWLGSMAGIAFKQAAVTATVAESYGMARTTMIPSIQSINNRVREAAAEASNFFGQNTPLIVALNAEYASYTMMNAATGTTYGQVITAATLPVPIPPPPPLGSVARAASDAGAAMSQAGQLVSQAGNGATTQAAQQAAQTVGQGSGAANPAGAMGQMSQLFQAPMQALQSLGSGGGNPLQSLQSLMGPVQQMFGQAGGLGSMLNGGSTGDAFSPMLTGAGGGLPLGSAGLGGGSGLGGGAGGGAGLGGGGMAGGGGLGGVGGLGQLASKSESAVNVRGGPVLSGVTSPGLTNERVAGAAQGGGMPMSPGAGGHGPTSERARRDSVIATTLSGYVESPRRPASGANRDLFS